CTREVGEKFDFW
nr:immunoglobulin heavy chain junction region [Macaca mulatta]MOX01945.1 immunoglobulin heavy chain junction region [Macaca mulatta]MOX02418.1 immunoglobulin heavy chain junction region [Macaca mulatta]MOX02458.1 immunoglobulin heavy chain junction region [Macaca mulatta]MOX03918.1 immunoglobulin heavy chain junction region [Macaca mulatta]